MRVFISSFIAVLLTIGTNTVMASTPSSEWPVSPSRLNLTTPYGELHVSPSDYVYESRLMLDDQEIEPLVQGLLNIPYAFSSPDFHVALISINTGDNGCPFAYKWIKLQKSGYSLTPRFGSCSEAIRVSANGVRFTMETPNMENNEKVDRYLYDGKVVKKE